MAPIGLVNIQPTTPSISEQEISVGEQGSLSDQSVEKQPSKSESSSDCSSTGFIARQLLKGLHQSVKDVLRDDVERQMTSGRFGPLFEISVEQDDHVLEEKHGFEQLYAYQSSPAVYEDKTGKLCTTMNSLVSIARKDGARILQEKIVTNRSIDDGEEGVVLTNTRNSNRKGDDVICWARQEYIHSVPLGGVMDVALDMQEDFDYLLNSKLFERDGQHINQYVDGKGRTVKEAFHIVKNPPSGDGVSPDQSSWTSWTARQTVDPSTSTIKRANKQRTRQLLNHNYYHDSWFNVVKTEQVGKDDYLVTRITVLAMHRVAPASERSCGNLERDFRAKNRRVFAKLKRVNQKLKKLTRRSRKMEENGSTSIDSFCKTRESDLSRIGISTEAHQLEALVRGSGGGAGTGCGPSPAPSCPAPCPAKPKPCHPPCPAPCPPSPCPAPCPPPPACCCPAVPKKPKKKKCCPRPPVLPCPLPPKPRKLSPPRIPDLDTCMLPVKEEPCPQCDLTAHCDEVKDDPCRQYQDPLFDVLDEISKIKAPNCEEMAKMARDRVVKELRGRWSDKILGLRTDHVFLSLPTFEPLLDKVVHAQLAQAKIAAMAIRYTNRLTQYENDHKCEPPPKQCKTVMRAKQTD